ncbi:hypothetical protein TrVE_jg1174 [Triparma verrucosa]|uniref:CS domain-containing protein n=1 Tax=Triparma verrucosa TaxID=1606542 RepID=A0A9W7C2N5_9STRA|nr:hypothetical protein TrVE_jg1174 [Triparma verrucosa]
MPTNTAPVKWAQRSDSLYVTISLPDVKDETITLTDAKLVFTGKSNNNEYACDFEFFKGCKAETSTYKVLPRSIQMHIMKAEEEEEFWPRLLKDKAAEKNQVKVDWDKYVDEDEEEEAGGFDTSGLEGGQGMMPGMGGMGGMPGMGGPGGPGGMDMEALMAQMGGMGGMEEMMAKMKNDLENKGGGEEEADSDDDDLPDLEES